MRFSFPSNAVTVRPRQLICLLACTCSCHGSHLTVILILYGLFFVAWLKHFMNYFHIVSISLFFSILFWHQIRCDTGFDEFILQLKFDINTIFRLRDQRTFTIDIYISIEG